MEGRCFCGDIQYQLTSPPRDAYYCHCRDCQYLSGSPFHVLAIVELGCIDMIAGETAKHRHKTQDGSDMTREFCPNCGTPLFLTSSRFADIQMFTVNTLDDPEVIKPSFQIWTTSKVSWAEVSPGIRCHPHGALDD
jgi:hypothetical protein